MHQPNYWWNLVVLGGPQDVDSVCKGMEHHSEIPGLKGRQENNYFVNSLLLLFFDVRFYYRL